METSINHVVDNDDSLKQVQQKLADGVPFDQVAKELSTDTGTPQHEISLSTGISRRNSSASGVGIAGVIGAICTILGCYGLAALPVRGWAVGLLVASIIAFAIDTQVGIPRFWTAMGLIMFVPASWFLFRSLPGTSLRLPWLTLIVGTLGVMFTFIVGMPSMVRTRFATPTIGREWMIGHSGTAVLAIDPNGVAEVSGARWRARTNRATPIPPGATLRVIGIDGVTLDVEPEEGAARDYRERRAKHSEPKTAVIGPEPGSADS